MKTVSKLITAVILIICVGIPLAVAASGLLMSGTYSAASTSSGPLDRPDNDANLTIEIIPTAISGVPSVTNYIEGLDSAGNAYTLCAGSAITPSASAVQVVHVGPSLTPVAASATGATCSAPIPNRWRVTVKNTAASSTNVTESVYYNTAR